MSNDKIPEPRRIEKPNLIVVIVAVVLAAAAMAAIFWPRFKPYIYDTNYMFQKPSGVYFKDLKVGKGDEALIGKTVRLNYEGYLADGTLFDSSSDKGEPLEFTLGNGEVIEGFDDGVFGMKEGGKRQMVISPDLAYGAEGDGGKIPPNATLIFIVKLLEVK
jgi:FKBP-type peptidyl-prolyl cis-trans isomerase